MQPLLVSTWSFGQRANDAAWPILVADAPATTGGAALEAVIAATVHAELDPTVDSVGYGGLPDKRG